MVSDQGLALRLREVREGAGVSSSALSAAAGTSRDFTRAVEQGRIASPSVEMVRRIADALGVSFEWLATGRGEAPGAQELERAADRVRNATLKKTGTEG